MTKYVIFSETNGTDLETWYFFINYEENKEELKYLKKLLEEIIYYDQTLSIFRIDLENKISRKTAEEMISVKINDFMTHQIIDEKIKLPRIKMNGNPIKNIYKLYHIFGAGKLENYII